MYMHIHTCIHTPIYPHYSNFQVFEEEAVLALCLLEHQGHHSASHRERNDARLGQRQASVTMIISRP